MDYILMGSILIPAALPISIRINSKTVSSKKWSANLGPTIGATLTFGGICLGLHGFDANNIDASLPILLTGLKTAFYSSLSGMVTKVVIDAWNKNTLKNDNNNIKDLLVDLISEIKASSNKNEEKFVYLIDSIQANSRQQFNLNTRLESFLEDFSKNSSKEIIEALQAIMESFNEKINDRLTESIDNLTSITANVIEYQKIENKQREKTIERLNDFSNLIASMKEDMEKICLYSKDASKSWYQSSKSSDIIANKSQELSDAFVALSSLSNDAKEASRNMNKYFDDWDREMNETTKQHIQTLAQHCHSIMSHMKNIIEKQAA